MSNQNPVVANLAVLPIDRTADNPAISIGGSAENNSGTGIFGTFGEINFAINGEQILGITEDGLIGPSEPYSGSSSFQPIAVDLTVDGAGSEEGTDPAFISPIMGNLLGDDISGVGNYLGGVIGAISAQGLASEYPTAGIMGIVMDGAEGVEACVSAVIDGSDPSTQTNVGAMFKARMNNNDASSGAEYGLDLYDPGNSNYSGGPVPLKITKAEVRMSHQVCVLTGDGAPVDGTTGDNFAGPGSLYIDYTNAKIYIQTSLITTPAWIELTQTP
jgi:hypothetical protein